MPHRHAAVIAAGSLCIAASAGSTIVLSDAAGVLPPRVAEQLFQLEASDGTPFVIALETADLGVTAYSIPKHGQLDQASTAYAGTAPERFEIFDLDGDGDLDPFIAMPDVNRISILRNNLPESIDFGFTVVMPGRPVDAAAADFNGDGRADIVAALESEGGVRVAVQETTGAFTAQDLIPTGTFTTAVTAADLNGDHKPDIAVANFVSKTLTILWNVTESGQATPAFVAEQLDTAAGGTDVIAIDLDNDGDKDLAGLLSLSGLAFTFENISPGLIANRTFIGAGASPTNLIAADINADAYPDLVAGTTANTQAFSIFVNDSSASFTRVTVPTAFKPQAVAAVDINYDGVLDLVASDGQQRRMATYINETEPTINLCEGDADGNLYVNIEDLLIVLQEFGQPLTEYRSDFDNDGDVGLFELLLVLRMFGSVCGED